MMDLISVVSVDARCVNNVLIPYLDNSDREKSAQALTVDLGTKNFRELPRGSITLLGVKKSA